MIELGIGLSAESGSHTAYAKLISWCGFDLGVGGAIQFSQKRIQGLIDMGNLHTQEKI